MRTLDTGIVAHALSKRFGSTQALGQLDLAIAPGETLGLLGHNGAGKTTAVRRYRRMAGG